MADPGPPTITELGYLLGYITEEQFRAMPEFGTYENRKGIPDKKTDVAKRANAAYARAVLEVLVQINEIFAGRATLPPALLNAIGRSWIAGDDGTEIVETDDFGEYLIQTPSHLWHLNGTLGAYLGGTAMVSNAPSRLVSSLMSARGGVEGEAQFIYGGRSLPGVRRHSSANLSGIGATMAFAAWVHVGEWNQSPNGIVIAAHRAFDRSNTTGASYRLGFELGLGYANGAATPDEMSLYYRHVNASNVEVLRTPETGGAQRIAMPFGREFFIAFIRTATTLNIYVNGLLLSTHTFGAGDAPSPGVGSEMRLGLGGDWDGSRSLVGSMRNVAVWTGAQPTAQNIKSYYRVGAGFIPKAPPT